MGKKIFALIQKQKQKFIDGCIKQGIPGAIGEKVFEFIEPFAGYGFNRSHGACYALIGYQTAYLKAHYPAEFMASLLTSDADNIDRVAIEVSECRDMGIEVLPPHINESFEEFAVIIDPETKTERIRFGLNAVKNVGHTVAREIVEERKRNGKYKNITNFVERVRTKDLNKKSIEAMAKVGALEGLGERNQILASMENILQHAKNFQTLQNSNQSSLFGASDIELPQIKLADAPPAEKRQSLNWEKELLGLYISGHPAGEYKEYLEKMGTAIARISAETVGKNITIGGVLTKIQKIYLKNQKTMLFATLEDTGGKIEILVFPKILEQTLSIWEEEKIILASGKISDKDGVFKLLADSAKAVTAEEVEKMKRIMTTQRFNGHSTGEKNISRIIITLPANSGADEIKKLSQFFDQCERGATKVYLNINNSRLETPYCIKNRENLKSSLQNIIPGCQVEIY